MKRSLVTTVILCAAALIVAGVAFSLKRVGEHEQAVRVKGDEVVGSYGPGAHFVPPFSGRWVTYPIGVTEIRVPRDGTFTAKTRDGLDVGAALELRIEIRAQSVERLHKVYGDDFSAALEADVGEAFEIVSARRSLAPGTPVPAAYGNELIQEIRGDLASAMVMVHAYRLEDWNVRGSLPLLPVDAEPLRKVLLVGVDGADWGVIRPLMKAGRLPNFSRLVRGGASGSLRSMEPMLSPLLWTTMATGKPPEEHGILNFTVADPETGRKVPINRLYRKVDAFWNMLSDYGRKVDIIGWLATFPAESINGVMVTDRLGYLAYADADKEAGPPKGSVSPEEELATLSDLTMKSESVGFSDFRRFADVPEKEFLESRASAFDPKNPVNNMIMLYASTRTYERIAKHLLAEQPDLLAVYFELVDATKHLFMHYAPPKEEHIDAQGFARYQNAVTAAYVEQDRIIGDLMKLCDDNTVVIVVSDHGFKSGDKRPQQRPEIWAGGAAFWHLADGVICMYGPGIRAGYPIEGADLFDIAPTVLALQGLPIPSDMEGGVLESTFEPELVQALNRTSVATLQRERAIGDLAQVDDATTEAALKKLEALGYITPDNHDAHNNLGQIYQKEGRYRDAIAEFEKALELNPNFPGALNNLGVCYGKLKEYDNAEAAFMRSLNLNPRDVFAMNNLAILFVETGRLESARKYAELAIETEPNYANAHVTLGSIYATIREFDLAEGEFERALRLDPDNRSAQTNLERLRSAMGVD